MPFTQQLAASQPFVGNRVSVTNKYQSNTKHAINTQPKKAAGPISSVAFNQRAKITVMSAQPKDIGAQIRANRLFAATESAQDAFSCKVQQFSQKIDGEIKSMGQSMSNLFEPAPKMQLAGVPSMAETPKQPSFNPSQFMMSALSSSAFTEKSRRTSRVVMGATKIEDAPTVTGDTNITLDNSHQDAKFLIDLEGKHLDLPNFEKNKFRNELMMNAQHLSTPGKGILASDESNNTCGKRLEQVGVQNTEENRQAYRELLYTAPGIDQFLSGVIMFDETARQSLLEGDKFVDNLASRGILSGIKVDLGLVMMEGTNGETITQGLDGLNARCEEYYNMGMRFAKWRAVIKIEDDCPSDEAILENARGLARYGRICQQNGLVPIIEPEILQDGTHTIQRCAQITEKVQLAVVNEMRAYDLLMEGLVIKPNMVTPGADCTTPSTAEEIAYYTTRTLVRSIPASVPGICFLSGGQSEEHASQNLNAMNKLDSKNIPFTLTFSFGRALQTSVLDTWRGNPLNKEKAQKILLERVAANGMASLGKYEGGTGSTVSDFVKNYVY